MLDDRVLTLKVLLEIETTTAEEARIANEANQLVKIPSSLLPPNALIVNDQRQLRVLDDNNYHRAQEAGELTGQTEKS